jgi:hypothetical protein
METVGLLLHSQEIATSLEPEPAEFTCSPHVYDTFWYCSTIAPVPRVVVPGLPTIILSTIPISTMRSASHGQDASAFQLMSSGVEIFFVTKLEGTVADQAIYSSVYFHYFQYTSVIV